MNVTDPRWRSLQSKLTVFFNFILAPDKNTVNVRNLTYNSFNLSTVVIEWLKPLFDESNVTKYDIIYRRRGNPGRGKTFDLQIDGVRPKNVRQTNLEDERKGQTNCSYASVEQYKIIWFYRPS